MCNVQLSAEHPSVLQHEKFNTTTFAKWMFRLKKDVPDLDPDSVIENWFYRPVHEQQHCARASQTFTTVSTILIKINENEVTYWS